MGVTWGTSSDLQLEQGLCPPKSYQALCSQKGAYLTHTEGSTLQICQRLLAATWLWPICTLTVPCPFLAGQPGGLLNNMGQGTLGISQGTNQEHHC